MVVNNVIWIFLTANDRSLFGPCHTSRNGRATATAAVLIRVLTDRGLPVNFWTIEIHFGIGLREMVFPALCPARSVIENTLI